MKDFAKVTAMIGRLIRWFRETFRIPIQTFQLYGSIGGEQSAAAFAYYALFSIVPLVALLLSVGSLAFSSDDIEGALETFVPLQEDQRDLIFTAVDRLEQLRGGISLISILILMWTSLRFFQALVRSVNEAWHTEPIPWWQLPIKNLTMIAVIGSSLILGILVPAIIQGIDRLVVALSNVLHFHFPQLDLIEILRVLNWTRYIVSTLVLFYAFSMLYMLAPRCRVRFRQVVVPALGVAVLLQAVQVLFVNILPHIFRYSEVYGPISSIMLLLMWIYISGQIIIMGGCFCAVTAGSIKPTPSTTGN